MRTLIDAERLQARISDMALEIDSYYRGQDWYRMTQEPVVVIGVLAGAMFFMADLVRKLSIRTKLDFTRMSTYSGKATTVQQPKIICPPASRLHDAHILLIDDILDTGRTIGVLRTHLAWPYPEDVKTAVLLRKSDKVPYDVKADFIGFDIPDEWVVGYGLDYNGLYRELPYVAVWSGDESGQDQSKS